jgi:hypothetical protein
MVARGVESLAGEEWRMHTVLKSSSWIAFLLFASITSPHEALRAAQAAAPGDSLISGICEGSVLPIGIVMPPEGFEAGCSRTYVLKHGTRGGERGRYGLVDLPPCSDGPCGNPGGHDRLNCELLHGNFCCTDQLIGREVETLAGNRAGPFLKAFSERFTSDTDQIERECYVEYTGNTERILRVVALTPIGPDSNVYRVAGFARFFMRERPDKDSGDLIGEFVPTNEVPE